ncbi:MAG: pilus assembly protein TadG-related protein [Pseudomonadota bacterium]
MPQIRDDQSHGKPASKDTLRLFAQREDGAMTIFACFMIFIMMMVCGIGVDMMRHEMERTRLQAVADRAVLAAADLDNQRDAEAVVNDYFEKAGMADFVVDIDPDVGLNYKIVTVDGALTFGTQFMDFLGTETLDVRVRSRAEERVPNVEIALILDTSSSMKRAGRLDALKPAAVEFINTVLADEVKETTSVTLIPYGGQVNPGPAMFERLNGVRLAATPLDESLGGVPQTQNNVQLPEDVEGGTGSDPDVKYVYPNLSSCLETHTTGFSTVGLPSAPQYDQTPYFHHWNFNNPVQHWGWCPRDEFAIQYHSNNPTQLNAVINGLKTYDGTGTHYAMKWGTALLDPSSADDVRFLAERGLASRDFIGRPAAYSDRDTSKFIILMTDGEISNQYRPVDELDPRNPLERLGTGQRKPDRQTLVGKGSAFTDFLVQCDLAKNRSPRPIIVYTIAFQGNNNAREQMRRCASSPSHYFPATEGSIAATFQSIARQINQLRLTQ